jgi:group I intron endonuclease
VGSALYIEQRWNQHKSDLARSTHTNRYLQRSWNKYGPEAFVWEILERVDPDDLITREQYFMDTLKADIRASGFNLRVASRGLQSPDTAKIAMIFRLTRETRDLLESCIDGEEIRSLTDAVIKAAELLDRSIKSRSYPELSPEDE